MSQQPLDYRGRIEPDTHLSGAARQYRFAVISVAVILNGILLYASLTDVFPRDRPGIRNVTAMAVGVFFSPILNGLLMLLSLGVGAAIRSSVGAYARVAVVAPLVGAVVNLGTVLVIVPWHGSAFSGLH